MQIQESYRELAIKDPEIYLNRYCEELSKITTIPINKINQTVKKEMKGLIPAHYFTEFVDAKFKNPSQLAKGKLRHSSGKTKKTKDSKINYLTKWLKKQPKDFVDSLYLDAIAIVEPEVETDAYIKK